MNADRMKGIVNDSLREVRKQASTEKKPDEAYLSRILNRQLRDIPEFRDMKVSERRYVRRQVINSILYWDVLTDLLNDDAVTEIMVNGPDKIYTERQGKLYLSGIRFRSKEDAEEVARRIIPTISFANPIGNARLPQGYRVNVVREPVALDSPTITIRKFSKKAMSVEMLIHYKSITREVADQLEKLVRAKYNIFVSGGTGSGKTTFLNALSNFIPRKERVITIEDPAELQLNSVDNLVRLETRTAQPNQDNAITIQDLIKSALRMRPDRIVVGEVRGAEALDMLQAMNTGHEGSMSTGHANSCRGMLRRLESLVLSGEAGGKLPVPVIRTQIAESLDLMIHLGRLRDKSRRVLEINEVLGMADGDIVLNPIYRFRELGTDEAGKIIGELERTENPFQNMEKLRFAGIFDEI